ncbi:MAG: plasmid partitioning protein RepB [Pseudomonadota bacterium]
MTKRKLAMEQLLKVAAEPAAATAEPPRPAVRAGAVRTMGLALDEIRGGERTGEPVKSLAPELIDPSFVRDRLEDGAPGHATLDHNALAHNPGGQGALGLSEIDTLAKSIEDSGQLVPILVRPSPIAKGRYQIAYGHRRWLACRRLGRPVRAVVRNLSDEDLVLAQGGENSERRDLSFIERAHFAAALMAHGMTRTIVGRALGVDKSELTRLLGVAEGLPEGLAARIGRAPRAGRPRWMRLVALIGEHGQAPALEAVERAKDLATDQRFKAVLAALEEAAAHAACNADTDANTGADSAGACADAQATGDVDAAPLPARVKRTAKATVITIDNGSIPGFGAFLEARLDALLKDFQKANARS